MSLAELCVIALVALIVIGPDKLPKVAYQCGKLWAKWQQLSHRVSAELDNQMTLGENQYKAEQADKTYQRKE